MLTEGAERGRGAAVEGGDDMRKWIGRWRDVTRRKRWIHEL